MAKILLFNNDTDRFEIYYLGENDSMPYNLNGTLKVSEFRGSSTSPTLWTTKSVMYAWNSQRQRWGSAIPVGFAFKRPWEGGHGQQSQHYAGTSLDVAQGWTNAQRAELRASAQSSGLWSYIEPVSISPTWVHFDRRQSPPACSAGYPLLREGSRSVYVLILQDGLNTLGYYTAGLDGVFGGASKDAVLSYQRRKGLTADGIVGCATWTALQEDVVGNGKTSTTIN